MPGSSRNQRRRNSKPRAVSRLRGYNVSPERSKRGRARENDGPRPSYEKERASSRPRSVASVVRLPDERHTKSRTRSRSRSPHQERRANRSESKVDSRVGNKTSEDAETSEQPEWAKDIKTIVAMQQNNAERLQFLETELRKANKRKDPKQDTKPEYKFSKCWNEEQFEFNKSIYKKLEQAIEESDEAERVSLLKEGMAKINERNKILTVTDCYGWEIAQAYLADPIASDSEDEKKLKKARKEVKANKEEKRRAVKSKRRENPSSKRPFHGSNARGSLPASHHSQSPTCWRCGRPGHFSRSCQAAIPAQPLPTRPVFGPSPNIPIQPATC